jgi:hypothetical protein
MSKRRYEPKGIYALPREERLELALALVRRSDRGERGLEAFRAAHPQAPEAMIRTAAFHLYVDGPNAVVDFLAEAELFLREPSREVDLAPTVELLYHVYNWLQFQELLPSAKADVMELLALLKECVADDDRDGIVRTAQELEDVLEGSQNPPEFT